MEAQQIDGSTCSSSGGRRRIDQFYQSKKRTIVSPKSGKCSSRRSSLDDTSPYKKGSLDEFLVSSKSPTTSVGSTEERRALVNASVVTSLCNRIEEESQRNSGIKPCSTLVGKQEERSVEVQAQEEKVQAEPAGDESRRQPSPKQQGSLNQHLATFADDFLSNYLKVPPVGNVDAVQPSPKKRILNDTEDTILRPAVKKLHADTVLESTLKMVTDSSCKETESNGDERNVEEQARPTPIKQDKVELMYATPECRPGTMRRLAIAGKPPCTPHSCTNQKAAKMTPNGWMAQHKYCSPGDAFWDEAIKVANDLLAPVGGCTMEAAACEAVKLPEPSLEVRDGPMCRSLSGSSPLPVRHFDFSTEENQDAALRSEPAETSGRQEGDKTDLSYWLPAGLCHTYAKKGVRRLYQWQVDCLLSEGVLNGKSLVYCASTSAGKSLVAEVLMLRKVLATDKKAILVLPYVALCSEKAEHLESLLEPLGKRVRSYFGQQGGALLPPDTSVAVCTIEKANSLANKLIEEGRLSELAVAVIDELHMVGDRDRGYLLELMLTKLRYAAGKGVSSDSPEDLGSSLQIVGMSATMPNVQDVACWLQAAFYQTDFRPVPLDQYIKVGRVIYNTNMETVRVLREGAELGGKDQEHVVELCNEVVQEGHSVLLFCSSRHSCETSARHVAKYLPKFSILYRENGFKDGHEAVKELQKCPSGLDPVLAETLPAGVAYHHAGLTAEEREVVEACFKQGVVRVLAATSTLAAGVNLPARRVIFRQPKVGCDFLDATRYRQMAGRAGRAGIDTKGESILICKPEEVNRMLPILNEGCQPLESCLAQEKNGMVRALLEVVAAGIVQSSQDVNRYVRCTLLNSTQRFEDVVKSAQDSLRWLCHKRLIEWDNESLVYRTTPLGKAAFGSSLTPEESLVVFEDLAKARECFVLASDLHIVFVVTPIYVDLEPDWAVYYHKFMQLSHFEQAVATRVGVTEAFLMRMAHGAPAQPGNKKGFTKSSTLLAGKGMQQNGMDQILRVSRRFYAALILSTLVQEAPLMDVCTGFKVPRGAVQALQDTAGRFAAMVATFCERLGWHDLGGLISKFQNRVSFGVRAEIAGLTEIPFVKAARARALYKAGLRTVQAVAEASIAELRSALFDGSSKMQDGRHQYWLRAAMAKKIKNGARKIVLDQAEEARKAAFSALHALGVAMPKSLAEPVRAKIYDEETEAAESLQTPSTVAELPPEKINEVEAGASAAFQMPSIPEPVSARPAWPHIHEEPKGPLDVDKTEGGFDAFLAMLRGVREFCFDLHLETEGSELGGIIGIAICWQESPVYYVQISSCTNATLRWSKLHDIFCSKGQRKVCWDLKKHLKAFVRPSYPEHNTVTAPANLYHSKQVSPTPLRIDELNIDIRIVSWLLWPDEEVGNLEQLVKKRLPGELAATAARAGRWMNQMGKVAHDGCCRRAAQIRALDSVMWKLLESEKLRHPLQQLEMPLVEVLAYMETCPIGVNMKACYEARNLLETRIKQLESKSQTMTGMNFQLSLPADVADLLYKHLNLPVPPGSKGKLHPSTDKQALEFLKEKHPVVNVIREHRSLSKLLQTTVGTVVASAKRRSGGKDSHYISGQWLHTSTGTGRLSMGEPNLQCIEHSISFCLEEPSSTGLRQVEVNARDFFVPTQAGWILLSADYSQIELRLMAHFSGDQALISLLTKPTGDLFRMIAAQWTGLEEPAVSDKQREQTKRMIYGILYGMGINTLAEKMECSFDEAKSYHERFKSAFPGVTAWIQEAIRNCRRNGHVETLAGRKRYLEKINNQRRGDQAKAERQAVSSICQGSAADLIKLAMIDLHAALVGRSTKTLVRKEGSETVRYSLLQGRCRLLLQIHDELLLEVDESILTEAATIVQSCMQGAALLKVPLNVKLQAGPSWGQLKPLSLKQ